MTIALKTNHRRHGNAVPFVVINTKKNIMVLKGSLDEVSSLLGITAGYASQLHISGKLYKKTYIIQRVGYEKVTVC